MLHLTSVESPESESRANLGRLFFIASPTIPPRCRPPAHSAHSILPEQDRTISSQSTASLPSKTPQAGTNRNHGRPRAEAGVDQDIREVEVEAGEQGTRP